MGTSSGQIKLVSVTENKAVGLLDYEAEQPVDLLVAFPANPRWLLAGNLASGLLKLFDVGNPTSQTVVAHISTGVGDTFSAIAHPVHPALLTGHKGRVYQWDLSALQSASDPGCSSSSPALSSSTAAAAAAAATASSSAAADSKPVVFSAKQHAVSVTDGPVFNSKGPHKVMSIAYGGEGNNHLFIKDNKGRVVQWDLSQSMASSTKGSRLVGTVVVEGADAQALDALAEAGLLVVGTDDGEVAVFETGELNEFFFIFLVL